MYWQESALSCRKYLRRSEPNERANCFDSDSLNVRKFQRREAMRRSRRSTLTLTMKMQILFDNRERITYALPFKLLSISASSREPLLTDRPLMRDEHLLKILLIFKLNILPDRARLRETFFFRPFNKKIESREAS